MLATNDEVTLVVSPVDDPAVVLWNGKPIDEAALFTVHEDATTRITGEIIFLDNDTVVGASGKIGTIILFPFSRFVNEIYVKTYTGVYPVVVFRSSMPMLDRG